MVPIGYGKIILLGEHFVVYGLPALVSALDLTTTIHLEQLDTTELIITDERPKVPTYKPLKCTDYKNMVHAVFAAMGIAPYGWHVTLSGTLTVTNGGIGASAAAAVALARTINQKFSLNWSDEQINQAAFCGEQEVHGTPSGIDNTAATYGGMFVFNGHSRTSLEQVPPLHLVLADSGRPTNTKHVLAAVSALRAQNAQAIAHTLENYHKIFATALTALRSSNLEALGQAMTQNHVLLAELGVSSPELDFLVDHAHQAGALGAKLTGTGCGGLMVALAANAQDQKNIAHALSNAGFFTLQPIMSTTRTQQRKTTFIRRMDTI